MQFLARQCRVSRVRSKHGSLNCEAQEDNLLPFAPAPDNEAKAAKSETRAGANSAERENEHTRLLRGSGVMKPLLDSRERCFDIEDRERPLMRANVRADLALPSARASMIRSLEGCDSGLIR